MRQADDSNNLFPPRIGFSVQSIDIVMQHFLLLCEVERDKLGRQFIATSDRNWRQFDYTFS